MTLHFASFMGQRSQRRLKTVLPVRLDCADSAGGRFHVMAHTLDVSHSGARIGGVFRPIAGETLDIQYRHRKAKFEILWISKKGKDHRLGLRALQPRKDVWGLSLEAQNVEDSFQSSRRMTVNSSQHT